MRIMELDSFRNQDGMFFKGALAFISGHKALLVEKGGHILLLDHSVCERIKKHEIPSSFINVLRGRGFLADAETDTDLTVCYNEILVKPEFFMIDLTNRCNMRCSYCLRNVACGDKSISDEVLLDICQYIEQYCDSEDLPHISIQAWGGEPLLEKKKLLMLKKKIVPQKTKVHLSIETNATLLKPSIAEELFKNRIGIGVSIDGMKEVHDLQRYMASGQASYEIVAGNLSQAQKLYGWRLGTITTVTKKNAGRVEEILEHFAIDLHLTNVKFNFVHNSTFIQCENLCMDSDKIAETQKRILAEIVKLQEQGYSIMEHNVLVKLKNLLFREYSDICLSCGCCGGRKMVVFDMEGNIYPCELTDNPEYKLGSIYDGREMKQLLADAIKAKTPFFEKKSSIDCENCYWKYFCQGGCTVRVFSNGKVPPEPDMTECAVNKVLYPELVKLILEKPDIVNHMVGWNVLESGEE